MGKRNYKAEMIISKFRQVDILQSQATSIDKSTYNLKINLNTLLYFPHQTKINSTLSQADGKSAVARFRIPSPFVAIRRCWGCGRSAENHSTR